MNNIDKIAAAIAKSARTKSNGYDAVASVVRTDGSTIYVHIDGGVDETPCQRTINCNIGDKVKVRVSNGKCWITGNYTAPPTDDTTANGLASDLENNTSNHVKEVNAGKVKTGSLQDKNKKFEIDLDHSYIKVKDALEIIAKNFTLTKDGTIKAKNGSFTGEIIAGVGKIGGWEINEASLTKNYSLEKHDSSYDQTREVDLTIDKNGLTGKSVLTVDKTSGEFDNRYTSESYYNAGESEYASYNEYSEGNAYASKSLISGRVIKVSDYEGESIDELELKSECYMDGNYFYVAEYNEDDVSPSKETYIRSDELHTTGTITQEKGKVLHVYGNSATTVSGEYNNLNLATTFGNNNYFSKNSNYQLKCTKAGTYLFQIRVTLRCGTSGKRFSFTPFLNGARYAGQDFTMANCHTYEESKNFTFVHSFKANDTIDFRSSRLDTVNGSVQINDAIIFSV